jgi:hypothetical protein
MRKKIDMQNRQLILAFVVGALLLLCVGIGAGVGIASYIAGQDAQASSAEILRALETREAAAVVAAGNGETSGETAGTNDGALPVPPTVYIPPTETNTPTATPIPTNTPTPTNTPIATDTPTATPTNTVTPTPTPSPTATREGPQARVIEDAGFFAGPGTSFGRRNYFATPGEMVIVLGTDEAGGWWHVISNANSYEGWVSPRFFELVTGDLDSLAVSTFRATPSAAVSVPSEGGSSNNSGAAVPPTNAVAYWNFIESSAAGSPDGTWSAELLVRVPTGFSYEFEFGTVFDSAVKTITDEAGYDTYRLNLAGMGCAGPYLADLIVKQNGARMVVQNEFNRQPGSVYIEFDCDG